MLPFAQHDRAHWRKALDDARIIFVLVARVDDIRHEEQVPAAGTSGRHVAEPGMWTIDSAFFVASQEKVPPRTAPAVGENSEQKLRAAGYDESENQKLRAAGVVGWLPMTIEASRISARPFSCPWRWCYPAGSQRR